MQYSEVIHMTVHVYRTYSYTYISYTFHIRTSLIFDVYIYICVYMLILIHIRIGDLAERLRKHDTIGQTTRRSRPIYAYTQVPLLNIHHRYTPYNTVHIYTIRPYYTSHTSHIYIAYI